MSEPSWAKRNVLLDQFKLENFSVVDFGCGDKSILKYQKFKEYIGLDKSTHADVIVDFDRDKIVLKKVYDIGLVLGVLEYLDNPDQFIKQIKDCAGEFIILVLLKETPKFHHGWKRSYSEKSFKEFLEIHFKTVSYYKHNNYMIGKCK